MYVEENRTIEDMLKIKFSNHLNPGNKEWIKTVEVEDILLFIRAACKLLGVEHKEKLYEEIYEDRFVVEDNQSSSESESESEEESEDESEDESEEESEKKIQRRCRKCKVTKDIDTFAKFGNGYKQDCKDCLTGANKPKRQCKICEKYKELSTINFQPYGTSGFKHECRDCVITKYTEKYEVRRDVRNKIDEKVGSKKCCRCDEVLSKLDFSKSSKSKDGLGGICKNCDHKRKFGEKATRLIRQQPKNIPENSKWCPKCEIVRLKTQYYKASKRPDGLQHSCKSCNNKTRVKNGVLKNARKK